MNSITLRIPNEPGDFEYYSDGLYDSAKLDGVELIYKSSLAFIVRHEGNIYSAYADDEEFPFYPGGTYALKKETMSAHLLSKIESLETGEKPKIPEGDFYLPKAVAYGPRHKDGGGGGWNTTLRYALALGATNFRLAEDGFSMVADWPQYYWTNSR